MNVKHISKDMLYVIIDAKYINKDKSFDQA
jgi:hypothetical protein